MTIVKAEHHGFLIAFSFMGSLFTDVRICAFPNSGRTTSAISFVPLCSLVAVGLEWKNESPREFADSTEQSLVRQPAKESRS